jgi:hypothetical protein
MVLYGKRRSGLSGRSGNETVGDRHADTMTREIVAAVHLRAGLAGDLLRMVDTERHRALYPSAGMDLRAVLGHAAWAQRLRLRRDLCLLGIVVLIAVGAFVGVPAVWSYAPDRLGWYLAVGPLLLSAAAYGVVGRAAWGSRRRAADVRRNGTRERARRLRLPAATERRLRDLETANVVVFSGDDPFLGTGERLGAWTHTIDLGRVAGPRRGSRRTRRFTASELHQHLRHALSGLDGCAGRQVLFVHGLHAPYLDELWQPFVDGRVRRRSAPHLTVADSTIEDFVDRPEDGIRGYLWLERRGWSNQLVTSMFVRLEVVGSTLLVEMVATALGPPGRSVRLGPHLPARGWAAVGWTLQRAADDTLDLLISCPRHAAVRLAWARRRRHRQRMLHRRLRHGKLVDYGARVAIRDVVAAADSDCHFMSADERAWFGLVTRRLSDAVVAFLARRGVDATGFAESSPWDGNRETPPPPLAAGDDGDGT